MPLSPPTLPSHPIPLPQPDAQRKKLEAMDDTFRNSGTLKALLEKSEANKAKNKREIQDK